MENAWFCTYRAFALVSSTYNAIRIGNATARSTAAFIEGKSKVKTLDISIY